MSKSNSQDGRQNSAMSNLSSEEIFQILANTEKLEEAIQKGMYPYTFLNQAYDLVQVLTTANDQDLKISLINLKIIADEIKFSDLTLEQKLITASIIDEVKAEAYSDIVHSCQKLIESYEMYIKFSQNRSIPGFYERLHFFLRLNDKTMAEEFLIKFCSYLSCLPSALASNLLMITEDKAALNNLISLLIKTEKINDSKDLALDFIALLNIDEIKSLKKSLQFDAINFTTKKGKNILYSTIEHGTLKNLVTLLENLNVTTIDINCRGYHLTLVPIIYRTFYTPLEYALAWGTPEQVQILLDCPTINFNDINYESYITSKNLQIILEHPTLSSLGKDFIMGNYQNLYDYTILHTLINSKPRILRKLLQHPGIDVNISVFACEISKFTTPLDIAGQSKNFNSIRQLLQHPKISITKNLYGLSTVSSVVTPGYLDSLSEEANIELWTNIIKEYDKYEHLHYNPFFKDALSKWEPKVKLNNSKEAEILSERSMSFTPDSTPQNNTSAATKIL